ncbi:MAG: MFS transporter [Micrococcaceae bacterium]
MSNSIATKEAREVSKSTIDTEAREPKGYLPKLGLATYGTVLRTSVPALGGLAIRLQHINDGDVKKATAELAIVAGVGSIVALFSQPLAGRLCDRTTSKLGMRRPWILFGAIFGGLAVLGIGLAPNMPTILIMWCLAQLFSNMSLAAITATLPDQVPEARRGIASSLYGAATPLAILTGAVLLALMPTDVMKFGVPGALSIVFAVWFGLTLKDRKLKNTDGLPPLTAKDFLTSFIFNPKKYPNFGWAWFSKFLLMFGYSCVGTYLVLFLADEFGMNTKQQTTFNMYANIASVTGMVTFSLIFGKISDRVGKRKVFVFAGGLIVGAGILLMAISPIFGHSTGLVVILIGEAIMGSGAGIFFAVDLALCTELLPSKNDTAKDLGVLNIANTLPQSLAPFIAGPIILSAGHDGYMLWFIIGSILAVLGGISVLKVKGVK